VERCENSIDNACSGAKRCRVFYQTIESKLPELREKYSVSNLVIFRSYIRREQIKDSYLDVMVKFDKKPGLLKYIELENYQVTFLTR
jgi:predicted nucleotidyltransferase